jgi:methyl-accepting chemotaxis protein
MSDALTGFGTSLAQMEALHAESLNSFSDSLAQRDDLHQQMAEAVAELAMGVGETFEHVSAVTAATLALRDDSHADALDSIAVSMAEHDALHQHMAETVGQLATGVGETLGHVAAATATAVAQLQERINQLEALVADLQTQIQALGQK